MTKLFTEIENLLPTLDGWTTLDKGNVLAAIVIALRPKIVCEIGCFGGSSAFPMALALKQNGQGVMICCDPWSSAASIEGYDPVNAGFWGQINHDAVYQKFLNKIQETGTQNIFKIHRVKSDDFNPPDNMDILHVDGQHTAQAVKDVNRYASKIRLGGICILDDLNWSEGHVLRAEARLRELGFIHLYPLGTGAVYQRIR